MTLSIREDLQQEIAALQAKLAIIEGTPEDIYPFGTVAVFAFAGGGKNHYLKTAEENWVRLKGNNASAAPLSEWIYSYRTSTTPVYFEVYILNIEETPIYASS